MIGIGDTNYKAFPIPEFETDIVALYLTFAQNGKIIVEYTLDDVDIIKFDDNIWHVCLHMPQEDSIKFMYTGITTKDTIKIQLRIRTADNEAFQSVVIYDRPGEYIKGGII